jgi:hypothetical protein
MARLKQAVVLIHGIGEQRPMDTLRGFVAAVLPAAAPGDEQYWSKPDPLSDLYELRRLQSRGREKVHFFEYYWAYQIEGTKLAHLFHWFFQLLLRRPRNVPPGLRTIWALSWILVLGLLVSVATGVLAGIFESIDVGSKLGLTSLTLALLLTLLQGTLVHYAGDAARYLSPLPQNIALRHRIRAEGVQLLRKLHASGEYERIVVVGHSLGSVIGYDIITRLWLENNEIYDFTSSKDALEQLLADGAAPQPVVRHELPEAGRALSPRPETLQAYRDKQLDCWKEQRRWGNPWRITDFISIGSPLAHAMLLLARNADEFEARKRQRELPTCPPVADTKGYAYPAERSIDCKDRKFQPLILHHAAAFGPTRWTNLYFPARFGLLGDVIGGPLQPVLGPGIQDVAVAMRGVRGLTPAAHTAYWSARSVAGQGAPSGRARVFALNALKEALCIDSPRRFRHDSGSTAKAGKSTSAEDDD